MTDLVNSEFTNHRPELSQQATTMTQISQDIWRGQDNLVEHIPNHPNLIVSLIADRTFRTEDSTPGFARYDSHEGPGLLTPASLRDNLLKAAKEQLSPEDLAKYNQEISKPWIHDGKPDADMTMHKVVRVIEQQMEEDLVKKAFGDLSITDRGQILLPHSKCFGDISETALAEEHLRQAIVAETHKAIKVLGKHEGA